MHTQFLIISAFFIEAASAARVKQRTSLTLQQHESLVEDIKDEGNNCLKDEQNCLQCAKSWLADGGRQVCSTGDFTEAQRQTLCVKKASMQIFEGLDRTGLDISGLSRNLQTSKLWAMDACAKTDFNPEAGTALATCVAQAMSAGAGAEARAECAIKAAEKKKAAAQARAEEDAAKEKAVAKAKAEKVIAELDSRIKSLQNELNLGFAVSESRKKEIIDKITTKSQLKELTLFDLDNAIRKIEARFAFAA